MIYWKYDFKQENKCKSHTHKTIRTNYGALLGFFLYPFLLSFSCVLSRFCLVFGFCRFLNNPFTLFLRYSVDYIWSTMEQWRQYLCRFLYTYDFLWSPPTIPEHRGDTKTEALTDFSCSRGVVRGELNSLRIVAHAKDGVPSVLCWVFFCTPSSCHFRVCYLDFALSSDSVVFWITPLPCYLKLKLLQYEPPKKICMWFFFFF
jgi:hypothetical protein